LLVRVSLTARGSIAVVRGERRIALGMLDLERLLAKDWIR
jgi:hypothetical protein